MLHPIIVPHVHKGPPNWLILRHPSPKTRLTQITPRSGIFNDQNKVGGWVQQKYVGPSVYHARPQFPQLLIVQWYLSAQAPQNPEKWPKLILSYFHEEITKMKKQVCTHVKILHILLCDATLFFCLVTSILAIPLYSSEMSIRLARS